MIVDHAPAAEVSIVALRSDGSHCIVVFERSDTDDDGLVIVKCGLRRKPLDRVAHIPSATKLSECRALVQTNEIHFPRLFEVQNCGGRLKISDIGESWVTAVRANKVKRSSVDTVIFDPSSKRPGCYRVTILFPRSKRSSTPLDARAGQFCIKTPGGIR